MENSPRNIRGCTDIFVQGTTSAPFHRICENLVSDSDRLWLGGVRIGGRQGQLYAPGSTQQACSVTSRSVAVRFERCRRVWPGAEPASVTGRTTCCTADTGTACSCSECICTRTQTRLKRSSVITTFLYSHQLQSIQSATVIHDPSQY